jgi:hypothetical protein
MMLSSSTVAWSRHLTWCACCLVLLLSSSVLLQVTADCQETGCGLTGTCILDTRSCGDECHYQCKCDIGFAGADCSFQAVTCPGEVGPDEVQTCFNGGTCRKGNQELNDEGFLFDDLADAWSCDCQAAADSSAASPMIVAGFQCEYVSQRSCEVGNLVSDYAFCVNGGTCLRMTREGKPHRGCLCGEEHEGRHCQYKKGTAPTSELAYMKEQEAILNEDAGLSGVGLFFVLLMLFGAFSGVGLLLYRHYQKNGIEMYSGNGESPIVPEADHDLRLDEFSGNDGDEVGEGNGDDSNVEAMHVAEIL